MLTREVMGWVALAILWVNGLLIAADLVKTAVELLVKRHTVGQAVAGRVARGDGPGGAFASLVVDQVGRAGADAASILFHDRATRGEVFGGELELATGGRRAFSAAAPAEVWIDMPGLAAASACGSRPAFDEAYEQARKARGFGRTVAAPIVAGTPVHVWAERDHVLVATMNPQHALARRAALGLAFAAVELAGAAGCTLLALTRPLFGAASTVGGVLGLGFFLAVQPLGKAVRDRMLVPDRAPLGGSWRRRDVDG